MAAFPESAVRIIGGEARGRRLEAPDTDRTRPILDRQKEALFNILMREFPCSGVLDLFCGSGSLGLEAVSRGAERATLVEKGRVALKAVRQNVQTLGWEDRVRVRPVDAFAVDPADLGHPVSAIFLDPPFPLVSASPDRFTELLARLGASPAFEEDGVIVLRVPREHPGIGAPEGLVLDDEREFGESRVTFWRRGGS